MIKDFDSQLDAAQKNNPSSVNTTESSASPAKPVPKSAVSEPVYKSVPSPRHYFTAEVRKRSPDDLAMVARDPFHHLHCELPLSFEENKEGKKKALSLVCQFPVIGDCALVDFIEGDEDLLGMVLISFHVHILNNLFSFCAAQKVQNLIIKTTEEQFQGLEIYEEFIQHVDKIPTHRGMNLEITIPFHKQSLKQCDEFMDDATCKFRKDLWKDKSSNPAIRNYLKANVRMSIVA